VWLRTGFTDRADETKTVRPSGVVFGFAANININTRLESSERNKKMGGTAGVLDRTVELGDSMWESLGNGADFKAREAALKTSTIPT